MTDTETNKNISLPSPASGPSGRRALWFTIAIAAIAFAVFYPVLNHWFVYWDDDFFILRNTDIDPPTWKSLARFWAHPMEGYNQFLVPLNYTVWWLLAHVARTPASANHGPIFNPSAFHSMNLAFHMIASCLAFGLLRKLTKSDWASAAGALFFAINPLQAEPVSWASNMYTPLSGALALGALLGYLNSNEKERGVVSRRLYFAASSVCFVLALLSKPSVVLLPLIALAIAVVILKRPLRDCWPLAIWAVIGLADALLTHHIHKGTNAFQPPVWQRVFVAGDALAFYLVKLVAPFKLIPDYGRAPARVLGQWITYFVWILPAGALLCCWLVRRRFPWLICGAIIFVLGVFPMLGLVPFDFQGFSTVADRYLYLSIFGASVAIAFAFKTAGPIILQSRFRAVALGGSLAVALVLAVACRAQVNYWQDTGTLFHRTLAVNPHSEVAHVQLGYVLLNQGGPAELEEALDHYRAVLEVRPHDPPLLYNIALALCRLERQPEAIRYLRDACQRAPRAAMVHYQLADTLAAIGDRPGALAAFNEVFRNFPEYSNTELRLARAMAESGDRAGAAKHYQNYLHAHPTSAEARSALSRLNPPQQQAATDGR